MSHPRELLSALLDGELAPEERLRVEQHVATCPACADELGELALVDEWARDEQVVAPDGYFEALPGRLRSRLRASAAPARPRRLVPQWAWAAAALVLVGLLIPITFLRREQQAPMATSTLSPQAGAAATPVPEAVPSSDRAVAEAPQVAKQARPLDDRAAPAPAAPEPKRPADIPEGFSAPPPPPRTAPPVQTRNGADQADELTAMGYVGEAKPDEKDKEELRRSRGAGAQAEGRLEAREQQAPQAPGAPASAAAGAPASAPAGTTTGAVVGLVEPERKLGYTNERDARADADRQPGLSGKRKAEAPGPLAYSEDGFATLATAELPRTAAEARVLRLRWRAFADAHPEDPRADEARVRAIEAAALALRLSGERADRETLRRDVTAYSKRSDAAQKARVSALSGATRD